jgi:hypothetical protein
MKKGKGKRSTRLERRRIRETQFVLNRLLPSPNDGRSLREVILFLRGAIFQKGGTYCPACTGKVDIYPRRLNKTMAKGLMWLTAASKAGTAWVDIPNTGPRWLVRSNQLPTLRYWGLVVRKANEDPSRKGSGFWKPTKRGVRFAKRRSKVSAYVVTFKDQVVYRSKRLISVDQTFKTYFDYRDIKKKFL